MAETLEGEADGDAGAVTVTVVAGAVVVTVTVGLAGAVTLGLAGAVTVGLAGVVAVGPAEPDRLVKLLIPLETLLPMLLEHPAARHATSRMAAARKRLLVERRMLLPSALFMARRWTPGTVVMIPPVGPPGLIRYGRPCGQYREVPGSDSTSTFLLAQAGRVVRRRLSVGLIAPADELGAHLDRLDRSRRARLQRQPDGEEDDAENEERLRPEQD